MRGSAHGAVGVEERGNGVGISASTLQRMGGHDPAGFGMMDGGVLGGSLQLPEGG